LKLAPQGMEATVQEGLAALQRRRLVTRDLEILPGDVATLNFYAASIHQRLSARPGQIKPVNT